jgi:DNA-binding CsgD family transcriptional regulator
MLLTVCLLIFGSTQRPAACARRSAPASTRSVPGIQRFQRFTYRAAAAPGSEPETPPNPNTSPPTSQIRDALRAIRRAPPVTIKPSFYQRFSTGLTDRRAPTRFHSRRSHPARRTKMDTAASVNDLIAQIYDASVDPSLWEAPLLRMSDLLGGSTAALGVIDPAGQGDIVAIRCAPEAVQSFATYYAERNPMVQHLPNADFGKPFTDRCLMSRAQWQRTEFYNDWGRSADNHTCLLMPVLRSGGRQGWFAAARSSHAGDFEPRHMELAELLAPHLRRALEIGRKLDAARTSGAPLLEQLTVAALCLDSKGRVVWANARAEALLEARDGVSRTRNNTLVAVSNTATAALQKLVRQAGTGLGGMQRLDRLSGRPSLVAVAVPMRGAAAERAALPPPATNLTTTLFIIDSTSNRALARKTDQLAALRELYGLTLMEAKVALRLAGGVGIPEVASSLSIAPSTVRTHTKSLYQKMGLHSQAELICLVGQITLFSDALS